MSFYFVLFLLRGIKNQIEGELRTMDHVENTDQGEVMNAKGRRGEVKEFCLSKRRKKWTDYIQKPRSSFVLC